VCVRGSGGVQNFTHHLYLYISKAHSHGSQGTKYVFNVVAKKFLIPKTLVLLANSAPKVMIKSLIDGLYIVSSILVIKLQDSLNRVGHGFGSKAPHHGKDVPQMY